MTWVDPVIDAAPGFRPRFLSVVEAADGAPGVAAVLTELADYVAELAGRMDQLGPELARCLAAVEQAAGRSDEDADVVAWAFLDSLSPDERMRLAPWFGPRTRALAAEVDGDAAGGR
jgi:hypothetical protein